MRNRSLFETRMNRRQVGALGLGAAALGGLAGLMPAGMMAQDSATTEGEIIDVLRFRRPNTLAFAAPFAFLDSSEQLTQLVSTIDVDEWSTPDILRSLLVSGETDVTAVPTYVGANLFNKGVDVRMAAVLVWGLLWVIGPEGTPSDWESLRGQTIMAPYRNDMPDLVFRSLLEANGLTPGEDLEIEYFAQPTEVVQRLVSGKGAWAVLQEHSATLALAKAAQEGHALERVIDLQEAWGAAYDSEPRYPQAGVVVPSWIADERPDVLGAVLDALTSSVAIVNEASPETVAALAESSELPEAVVADVIPRLHLDVVPGGDAQEELEAFYSVLAAMSPDIIGGQLPDASFYLNDPR